MGFPPVEGTYLAEWLAAGLLILFAFAMALFDLPGNTKRQRHAATFFRNIVLDMGYGMLQYSVYVRYTPTQSGNRATVKMIKDNLPANGLVRILHISDHQWSTAARFSSGKREIEEETPDFLTLF